MVTAIYWICCFYDLWICTVCVCARIHNPNFILLCSQSKKKRFNTLMSSTPWRLAMNGRKTAVATLWKQGTSMQQQLHTIIARCCCRWGWLPFFSSEFPIECFCIHSHALDELQSEILSTPLVIKESNTDACRVGAEIKMFENFAIRSA